VITPLYPPHKELFPLLQYYSCTYRVVRYSPHKELSFGKYGRKVSLIVKRYRKYGRKLSFI
jgi:hypothetical protein